MTGSRTDLHQVELLDCRGAVSHTLTIEIDGRVRIDFADGRTAHVDPSSRQVLPPTVHVPRSLVDHAVSLRPW